MEKEKNLDITNLNGMSSDDDTTCGLNDMNCVETKETASSITNMNSASSDDDTTCNFTDMNCTGEN